MLGKNIKYYRLMSNMSQGELAQRIGLNKVAVSNYELGKRTPDLATIRKIADALCVNIGRLTESYGDEVVVEHGAFRNSWLRRSLSRPSVPGCFVLGGSGACAYSSD